MNMNRIPLAIALLLSAACLPTANGGGGGGGGGGSERCGVNEYASGGECVACAETFENAAGDDPADGDTKCDPILTPGKGRLMATPDTVAFGFVDIGTASETNVVLENIGDTELTITSLELVEDASDVEAELTLTNTFGLPRTVEPGGTVDVGVEWRPLNTTPDAATITLTLEDAAPEALTIDVTTPSLEPDIAASPGVVIFPRTAVGEVVDQVFEIQNVGGAPLEISNVLLSPVDATEFVVSFPTPGQEADPEADTSVWPDVIEPGESAPVRVTFTPTSDLPIGAEVLIRSNDPDTETLRVGVTANASAGPVAELAGVVRADAPVGDETHTLTFGPRSIGLEHTQNVRVRNTVAEDLVLDAVDLSGDGTFSIPSAAQLGLPITLGRDEEAVIEVTFTPTDTSSSVAELALSTNDTLGDFVVRITGEGTEATCAEPIALARVGGSNDPLAANVNAAPLNTIEFDASSSTGDIIRYEWELVQKPINSNARLTPNNEDIAPRMFLDLVGQYVVDLTVYGPNGTLGCRTSTVTINAMSTDALFFQLVWDTPGDANQTDTTGTDLDLHYLNNLGSWDAMPYDIYWRNATADWGEAGDPSDDPSLDIDDSDGAGPENINHAMPSPNEDFSLGVYYYSDNGFGASYATVRIFVNGTLDTEWRDRYLEREGVFWYVADIDGATLDVTEVNTLSNAFP